MRTSDIPRAVAAAAFDLGVDDATVRHASNRVAVRLEPCGLLARVADADGGAGAAFEVDVAHAPEQVGAHYPAADPVLPRQCRTLTLAIATAWRWDRLPNGRELGRRWLDQLRHG